MIDHDEWGINYLYITAVVLLFNYVFLRIYTVVHDT